MNWSANELPAQSGNNRVRTQAEGETVKTVPLADVLWRAANRFLEPTGESTMWRDWYSCNAVAMAAGGRHCLDEHKPAVEALRFLRSMGCDPSQGTAFERQGIKWGEQLQGVRYMWLLLAMHAAEDEQIMVEVA